MTTLAYRPEIDGLRGLAVLAVVGFHAGLQGLSGGYLGVDIFFVISGYLITSIIVRQHEAGAFSLRRFWERRARRILPLLTTVVLASLVPAWFLLAKQDAEDFAQSLIAIFLFASNVLFWREGTYFATAAEFKPLLHTWSLAVEEQFYLVFPVLCAFALSRSLKILRAAIVVALAIGVALHLYLAESYPEAAFYLAPSRGWQLLAGAVCAIFGRSARDLVSRPARAIICILAILAILVAIARPDNMVMPLIVTVAASALVVFTNTRTAMTRLLAWRPLVGLGLISYGVYLWHVPLLVFARHAISLTGNPEFDRSVALPVSLALALCVASVALAAITWRYVEQPARNRSAVSFGRLSVLAAGAWAIILVVAATMMATHWQQRTHLQVTRGIDADQSEAFIRGMRANEIQIWSIRKIDDGDCVFGGESLDRHLLKRIEACHEKYGKGVLLFGDSHAETLHNVLAKATAGEARFIVTVADGGCRIAYQTCFYPELARALSSGFGDNFRVILYHEAGSNSIVDDEGSTDSQRAFAWPQRASIYREAIDQTVEELATLSRVTSTPVEFVGIAYEPRINLARAQPLFSGWVPRPTVRRQFEQLDRVYRKSAAKADLAYHSIAGIALAPRDTIMNAGCLLYRDLDHLSVCGEDRMAQRLLAENPALLANVIGRGP